MIDNVFTFRKLFLLYRYINSKLIKDNIRLAVRESRTKFVREIYNCCKSSPPIPFIFFVLAKFLSRVINFPRNNDEISRNQNARFRPPIHPGGMHRDNGGLGRKKDEIKEVIGVRRSSTPVSETVSAGKT